VLRDEARQTQERLRAVGLNPGAVDGVPGQQTVTALRQYQKAHGLSVTGLLDDATRQALGILPEPAAVSRQTGEGLRFTHQPTLEYPEVARSSGHAVLDTVAQEAAKTWKHVPAIQDGTLVTRWAEMTLTFQLDKGQAAGGTKPQ
jgi:TonB family protein